jgi:amphi-Trp domain-containing protein
MPEEVIFKSESQQSREDVAAYLRRVADSLEAGGTITLTAGEQSVTVDLPARPTFEVKVEREGQPDRPGELSIEFELEWPEDGGGDDSLTIQ